jgi:hypothetical protein
MLPAVPASTRWLRQVQDVRMAVGFEGPNAGGRAQRVSGTHMLQEPLLCLTE